MNISIFVILTIAGKNELNQREAKYRHNDVYDALNMWPQQSQQAKILISETPLHSLIWRKEE